MPQDGERKKKAPSARIPVNIFRSERQENQSAARWRISHNPTEGDP